MKSYNQSYNNKSKPTTNVAEASHFLSLDNEDRPFLDIFRPSHQIQGQELALSNSIDHF